MARDDSNERRRFDDLVLWYMNGNISSEDRVWVESYLQRHPEARHALHWHAQLKDAVQRVGVAAPQNVGLDRLMQAVGEHEHRSGLSFAGRLQAFLAVAARWNYRPAFAIAALLVVAQSIGLGVLSTQVREQQAILQGYSETRAVVVPGLGERGSLNITFKNDASERDMRALMIGIQGRIVDGPDQLGRYIVAVPGEQVDEAKAKLESSPIVELVVVGGTSGQRK